MQNNDIQPIESPYLSPVVRDTSFYNAPVYVARTECHMKLLVLFDISNITHRAHGK